MKTDINILQGNKLIAEFMGLEIITDGISWFDTNYKSLGNYDSSWDWLMPAVEKIAQLPTDYPDGLFKYLVHVEINPITGIEIEHTYKRNFDREDGVYVKVYEHDFITDVWVGVVEFIKWYNLNK